MKSEHVNTKTSNQNETTIISFAGELKKPQRIIQTFEDQSENFIIADRNRNTALGIDDIMDIQSVEKKLQARLQSYQEETSNLPKSTGTGVRNDTDEDSFHTAAEQNSVFTTMKLNGSSVVDIGYNHQTNVDSSVVSVMASTELQSSSLGDAEPKSIKEGREPLSEFVNDNLNLPHPALEFPPLYFFLRKYPFLLEPFQKLYSIRWSLSYPLQRRVPASNMLRKMGVFFTYGELLLTLPFIAFLTLGTVRSFVDPSVSITGHASRTPLIFAFATGTRNSFLTLLVGIPFERSLWYHKLAGRTSFVTAILHTYVAFAHPSPSSITGKIPSSAWSGEDSNFFEFCFSDSINTGGTLLFLAITVILVTSIPYLRRRAFEFFLYIHVVFATACLGCAFYHTGVFIPILGSLTWGVDILLRKVYMAHFRYPKRGRLRHISDTVVELSFPKTREFDYNPGQYIRLAVPDLSIFEWHPFSLSSCPLEENVTICIRKAGTWTKALHKLAESKEEVNILLEGPYGSTRVDLRNTTRYKMIMIYSGGIGVTPMQSICNQLVFEHATKRREIKKLCFYWIERDPTAIQNMDVFCRRSSIHRSLRSLDLDEMMFQDDNETIDNLSISQSILSKIQEKNCQEKAAFTELSPKIIPTKSVSDANVQSEINEDSHSSFHECDEGPLYRFDTDKFPMTTVEIIDGSAGTDQNKSDSPGNHFLDEELGNFKSNQGVHGKLDSDHTSSNFIERLESTAAQNQTNTRDLFQHRAKENDDYNYGNEDHDPYGVLDMNMFLTVTHEANNIARHPFVQTGRPDLDDSFINMKADALKRGEKRVAVCVCAPKRLMNLCKKACIKYSDADVRFDLHEEILG